MMVLLGAEVSSGRAIARKLRSERYCCKLLTSDATVDCVRALDPAGILIAGEESEGAMPPDPALLALGLPVLAFGSAARSLLGKVGRQTEGEITDTVLPVYYRDAKLFDAVESGERWIARANYYEVDAPYRLIADGDGVPLAFGDDEANLYLVQYQIERNDPDGMAMLRTFAADICGCTPWWSVESIIRGAEDAVRQAVGDGEAICAMSGGLDSTVAAMLARRAIGDRARCVFVDTGLLREGESEETERYFAQDLGLNFMRVDASGAILSALAGLKNMDQKWQVIEREIAQALHTAAGDASSLVFIKGTNFVDILSCQPDERENEAGAWRAVEPLGELFKDEIRRVGEALELSPIMLNRQPFPGMGLAARIHGEVTRQRLTTLRQVDAIFADEIAAAGQDKRMDRFFAMLSSMDGGRIVIVLRAMQGAEPRMNVARLPYDLLERTVERIKKELPDVDRVLYDMTPGVAEWPLL